MIGSSQLLQGLSCPRVPSVAVWHLLFFLQLWLFTVHHQCQDLLLRIGRSMQMSEYFGDSSWCWSGTGNLSKNLKANLKLFGIYELKTSIQKTSDIIRSLPWKDAEKKTKQQTSKPSGVTIKFTTVHWADTWQTSHYWQGWWAIGIPVANSPNESENCGTFKWKQMFPAGFWPLGGSAGSPAWIEDKVGTSHHTKFAQPNVLCNLEKSLPKTDWYRLIFNCRFLSTFSIFLWVPNSSKPSDYWTHLIETQFT